MERCTREREVAACDEVLGQQPNNTKILIAKGDALVEAHRPAEASKAYIRASELAPNDTALTGKLQALQSQRQALVKRCTDGDGDAALQACKSVLVKGAPNEFETTVRIALLQQSTQSGLAGARFIHRGQFPAPRRQGGCARHSGTATEHPAQGRDRAGGARFILGHIGPRSRGAGAAAAGEGLGT